MKFITPVSYTHLDVYKRQVPGNVKSNEQILGTPAIDAKNFMKSSAVYKKRPEIYTTLNAMQKEIEELKKQLNK